MSLLLFKKATYAKQEIVIKKNKNVEVENYLQLEKRIKCKSLIYY